MGFVHPILRMMAVLLFSVLGSSIAFALPQTASDIAFSQTETSQFSQADHIGFTARARPIAGRILRLQVMLLSCRAVHLLRMAKNHVGHL